MNDALFEKIKRANCKYAEYLSAGKAYGFEVNKQFCKDAEAKVLRRVQKNLFV